MRSFYERVKSLVINRAVFARLFSVFCTFWMQVVLARLLSAHDFGVVQMALSYSFLFAYIATLGIPFFMLKALPEEGLGGRDAASQLLFQGLKISAFAALAVTSCLIILEVLMGGIWGKMLHINQTEMIIVASFFVLFSFNYSVSEVFRGFGNVILANFVIGFGITGLVSLIGTLLLFSGKTASLQTIMLAFFLGSFLTLSYGIYRLRERLVRSIQGTWSSRKQLLRNALPFFANLLIVYLASQVDLWVVFYKLDAAHAGFYAQAAKLVQVFAIYQTAILATVPTQVIPAFHRGDYQFIKSLNRRIGLINIGLILVPCLVYIFAGESLLRLVFKTGGEEQAHALAYLAVGAALSLGLGPQSFILSLIGKIHQVNLIQIGGVLLFLAAIFVSPELSLSGVALSIVAINVSSQLAMRWLMARMGST